MATSANSNQGRLNKVVVLAFVTVLVLLLVVQTWCDVMEALQPDHPSSHGTGSAVINFEEEKRPIALPSDADDRIPISETDEAGNE